jgi:thiamine biosynthesis lipoprotein
MGTILDITLLGPDEAALRRDLEWAFERVAELEAVASRHRADSALTRFNAAAGQPPSPAESPDLRALLSHSVDASRTTGGAFDVTVGPLIRLWMAAAETGTWPDEAEIASARSLVGREGILLEPDGDIGLASPGRVVDFGGIAKGYALDVVHDGLVQRGITRGLLDFGGSSVWAMGRAPDGGPWLLEVDAREPDGPRRVLALENAALSVSSSLGDTSTIEGRVIGHVIDPRSGLTIDAPRTAVAIGDSATRAEAWSTALLVLDEDEGRLRASEDGAIEAWVRFESGHTASTPGFGRFWARAQDTSQGPPVR